MIECSPAEIQTFISGFLSQKGRELPTPFSDQCDLLLSGIVDSLGMLELITAIQEHCQQEIDFDALDPELMTVVGPLCQFVAEQIQKP
jgi:acyl carrier protein